MLGACLAGPVTANGGIEINIITNSSSGRRRLQRTPNNPGASDMFGPPRPPFYFSMQSPEIPPTEFDTTSLADTNDTTDFVMAINEAQAYFDGKIRSNQLVNNNERLGINKLVGGRTLFCACIPGAKIIICIYLYAFALVPTLYGLCNS